jgi:hypothetical protein
MALQYVGGNTATKAGATSGNSTVSLTALTGGISSSAAAGDIVIAVFATGSTANRTLTITDGTNAYTLIDSELYSNGASYDTNLRVAYRRVTVAGGSVTFGPTGNAADAGAMAVHVWRGVDGNTQLDVAAVPATGIGTGRPNGAAITPVTSGAIVIVAAGAAAATGAVFVASGLSNFRTATSSDTNDAMVGIGSFAWTSGAYDPAQWTGGTTGTADSWAAITLAIRPASDPTGTLSATETGSDTFTATGEVIVKGTLSATETGVDTFASTGKVIVEGSLSATETGDDTFDAQGSVTGAIVGDLHAFESIDTFSSSGKVLVSGAMTAVEQNDTFASTGKVIISGTLSATETGADTLSASGKVLVQGSLDVHETGSDAFASTGKVIVKGSLAATETGSDTFDSQGSVTGAIVGDLHATETGSDTLASTGKVLVSGSLSATESAIDTFSATGKVYVTGSLDATEVGLDTFDAQGDTIGAIVGDLHGFETGSDTLASTGKVIVAGSASLVEVGNDTADILGVVTDPAITGSLAANETGADAFVSTGKVLVTGSFDASEFDDEFFAEGFVGLIEGAMAATEVGDDIFYAYQTARNIWDTEQGVAKGYAKFTPMQDAEPFIQEQKVESATATVQPITEAAVVVFGEKCNVSFNTVFEFKANGFAPVEIKSHMMVYERILPIATGVTPVFMFKTFSQTAFVTPISEAKPIITQETVASESGVSFPWGVRNPSDEEIITLILESRKRRHLTQNNIGGITRA